MIAAALLCLVVGVSDGDTLKVRCGTPGTYQQLTLRLSAVDAPEKLSHSASVQSSPERSVLPAAGQRQGRHHRPLPAQRGRCGMPRKGCWNRDGSHGHGLGVSAVRQGLRRPVSDRAGCTTSAPWAVARSAAGATVGVAQGCEEFDGCAYGCWRSHLPHRTERRALHHHAEREKEVRLQRRVVTRLNLHGGNNYFGRVSKSVDAPCPVVLSPIRQPGVTLQDCPEKSAYYPHIRPASGVDDTGTVWTAAD